MKLCCPSQSIDNHSHKVGDRPRSARAIHADGFFALLHDDACEIFGSFRPPLRIARISFDRLPALGRPSMADFIIAVKALRTTSRRSSPSFLRRTRSQWKGPPRVSEKCSATEEVIWAMNIHLWPALIQTARGNAGGNCLFQQTCINAACLTNGYDLRAPCSLAPLVL